MRQLLMLGAIPALVACSGADVSERAEEIADRTALSASEASEAVRATASKLEPMGEGVDLTTLPAGTYADEDGHAYIQFSYDHQGFSRPVLRWSEFDAVVDFDPADPSASTLRVEIPVDSIDSMVPVFDDHLKSADFFDADQYPTITFESTSVDIGPGGTGTVTGNLTIKDITRPVTLQGRVNKIGKHFRSGVDMFGISGTGSIKRSDFGVDKYTPSVGDEVDLVMEIEFQRQESE